jgi:hypothetical protein
VSGLSGEQLDVLARQAEPDLDASIPAARDMVWTINKHWADAKTDGKAAADGALKEILSRWTKPGVQIEADPKKPLVPQLLPAKDERTVLFLYRLVKLTLGGRFSTGGGRGKELNNYITALRMGLFGMRDKKASDYESRLSWGEHTIVAVSVAAASRFEKRLKEDPDAGRGEAGFAATPPMPNPWDSPGRVDGRSGYRRRDA